MTDSAKLVSFDSLSGVISGESKRGAVLLSHGAGSTMENAFLVQTAEKLKALGFLTMRWNFGYVSARRAPSAGGKREIPEMNCAVEFLRTQAPGQRIFLIGKSFGGRLSTYLAKSRSDISGFVFFGLPLKGAGKNAKPRDWCHLSKLTGQALFVTGDKDKLCPLDDLVEAQKNLAIPFKSEIVPGNHSFKPRGEALAMQHCAAWMDANF